MSTVINHYRVNYLASHLQFWYIRESLARRSPTAELVLWNFPLHELQKGTWTRTEWFLWCYYRARYPWHRPSAFPLWSRCGATHTMEDAALTIPLVIKLWYWGGGGTEIFPPPKLKRDLSYFPFVCCTCFWAQVRLCSQMDVEGLAQSPTEAALLSHCHSSSSAHIAKIRLVRQM